MLDDQHARETSLLEKILLRVHRATAGIKKLCRDLAHHRQWCRGAHFPARVATAACAVRTAFIRGEGKFERNRQAKIPERLAS